MADKPQSASSHAKMVPLFHYVAAPFLLFFAVWAVMGLVRFRDWDHLAFALLGIAAVLIWMYARLFGTQNQDRIIRLEERLRMREVLPADMHARINEFTTAQLVSLRFASDGELPALAKRVLDERITDRKAIKALVTNWRPDHHRV